MRDEAGDGGVDIEQRGDYEEREDREDGEKHTLANILLLICNQCHQ